MDISKARCAECEQPMQVERMVCPRCEMRLEGDFEIPALARLSMEDQAFVVAFLRHHGSIKKMENLFGISYPTVKNRLNAIARELDESFNAPEEAEKLLSRLETPASKTALAASEATTHKDKTAALKWLRVVIDGKDKLNVRVPIGLIRTGIKLTTLMPPRASEHLAEHGIDLSQLKNLNGEELMDALRELSVDVDSGNGDTVHVFCE
ncbi:MAG TPA: DUF2089 family protein [Candidatus Krumholzibacteria bacterium]|nr:DUF2089 family protein [Candidatus Krumholzibacteria bacterium]